MQVAQVAQVAAWSVRAGALRLAAPDFAGRQSSRKAASYDGVSGHQDHRMPINVSAPSHGVAPAAVPPQEPSSPRGGSSAAAQGGSAAELRYRKVPGEEAVRPLGVVKLPDLPKDLLRQVADPLPPNGLVRLSAVNKALNTTMGEVMGELLAERRAAVDKVRQMACESLKEQPAALNAAFAARDKLPPHERGGLMSHFAEMLDGAATPEARSGIADQLFTAAQGLHSPAWAEMDAMIAARIDRMPPAAREKFCARIVLDVTKPLKIKKADMLAPLQALAGQLEALPVERRFLLMTALAEQNRNRGSENAELRDLTLAPLAQAQLLATLSEGIRSMAEGEGRLQAFDWLRDRALRMPLEHRLPAQEALCRQIHELPVAQQAHSLWGICSDIRNVTAATAPLFADRLALKVSRTLPLSRDDLAWLLASIIRGSADLSAEQRSALQGEVHQMIAEVHWPGEEDVRLLGPLYFGPQHVVPR
jgi:hypothetical protein